MNTNIESVGAPIKISPTISVEDPGVRKFHKFNVSPKIERTFEGIVFDSKWEMRCYQMFRAADLVVERQPKFVLQPAFKSNGKSYREIAYEGDFRIPGLNGEVHVVDAKGMETDVFKMKEKMLLYVHGIAIIKLKKKKDVIAFFQRIGKEFIDEKPSPKPSRPKGASKRK